MGNPIRILMMAMAVASGNASSSRPRHAFELAPDILRLAQRLAAPQPHLAAQRISRLMISPQLLLQRLR